MSSPAALVTGASRGIGAETARRLAADGFDLTLGARGQEQLDALARGLETEFGIRATAVATDMADEAGVIALGDAHLAAFGRLDVVVLSAGMGSIGPFSEYPVRRFDKLFAVNVRSAFLLMQHVLPALRVAGGLRAGGKVIAIASMTGIAGEPLNSAYGATKAALISLCETINTEESSGGVSATAVCPGYVATAMTEGLADTVPQDVMLDVDDVAEAVISLTRLSARVVVPQLVLSRPGEHLWRA